MNETKKPPYKTLSDDDDDHVIYVCACDKQRLGEAQRNERLT